MIFQDPFAALLGRGVEGATALDVVNRPLLARQGELPAGFGDRVRLRRTLQAGDAWWELLPPHSKLEPGLRLKAPSAPFPLAKGTLEDRWVDFDQLGGSKALREELFQRYHNHWPEAMRFIHETQRDISQQLDVLALGGVLMETTARLNEARRPLIQRLRVQVERPLEVLRHRLTRTLARQHTMMPLRQIQELDAHCLRNITRQPGITPVEKAGARQELLGIKRSVTFDSWENRFLKAFIDMLKSEIESHQVTTSVNAAALEYVVQDHDERLLHAFKGLLDSLLRSEEFSGVGALAMSRIRLNNVLQRRPDYRQMFRAFQYLQRQKRMVASLWPHRIAWLADYMFWHWVDVLSRLDGARLARQLPSMLDHPRKGSCLADATYAVRLATERHGWRLTLVRQPSEHLADLAIVAEREALDAPLASEPAQFTFPCWVFWGEPDDSVFANAEAYMNTLGAEACGLVLVLPADPSWSPRSLQARLTSVAVGYDAPEDSQCLHETLTNALSHWLDLLDAPVSTRIVPAAQPTNLETPHR